MRVEVFSDESWAAAVAALWREKLAQQPHSALILPTGETTTPVYRLIAADDVLAAADLFLLDEFGLPTGHPARCDSMIQRDLLGLLPRPAHSFHALDIDADDLDAECRRYEELVRSRGIDLALLGLGGNGHLGLNEPGSGPDTVTRVVELTPETGERAGAYGGQAFPTWGVTMGISTLLAADELWLLVTGSHKAEILRRALTADIGPEVPATFLRTHPGAMVLADESAAALLGDG